MKKPVKNPFSAAQLKKLGKAGLEELRETIGTLLASSGRLSEHIGQTIKPARGRAKKNPGYGENREVERKALAKARDWFGDDALVSEPKPLRAFEGPMAAVEIGQIIAIEYLSFKFDGKNRVYRHEFTKKRKLYVAIDGSLMAVQPPFKVTKRGIEG